ncbi:hypothetical protein [Cetobacterium sp.]|uniref:hypothetical protein n=1 Tax=Cetobacterium sp. TaxID=2071632 RepID=UPI003F3B88C1
MKLIFEKKDKCYFVGYEGQGYRNSTCKIEDIIGYNILDFMQISFLVKNPKCLLEIEEDTLEEIRRETFFTDEDMEIFDYYKDSDFGQEMRTGVYPHIEKLLIGLTNKYTKRNKTDILYEKQRMYGLKYFESYYIFFRDFGVSNNLEFDGSSYSNYKNEINYIVKVTRTNENIFAFCEISKEEYEKNI